ncbi:MAG: GAF domain-containing protein [Deltaproteobacteria bacterium]|nr:GAF domain-containing protein [Deltaproteobacteria bacterium]
MISSSNFDQKTNNQLKVDIDNLSKDKRLNKLLKSVIIEVKHYAEDQIKHINQLTSIGLALSAEKNISKLLKIIVDESRELSNADGGTLYIVDDDKKHLRFEIMQNDTIKTRMGDTSGVEISLPKVPLYINGKPNHYNVSSYTALTGETVNIPDVYEAEGFDFTGPRKYDATTGYHSKSMLVIPMKNHENNIIGVLQLLNAKDPETGKVIAFSTEYIDIIGSLASQAAVALTNTQLIQDLSNLLYAFIKSIAAAIDEKSPYTGGHINRVVSLTIMLAETINNANKGKFKDVKFNKNEMEELKLAAWMHDVGKITTPEYVVDKSTKLQTIFDRINLIETRFQIIAKSIENKYLSTKVELMQNGGTNSSEIKQLDKKLANDIKLLHEELDFIKKCNKPDEFLSNDKIEKVKKLSNKTYSFNNMDYQYLTEDEVKNLCIQKGSLTKEERKIIENHVTMTLKILKELPFPPKLANVPEYAAGHHEKLDGSGYPRGLTEKEMPLQSRIMAVADIFEALTAKDRPYKKPIKLSQAVKIMGFMKKNRHIDPDIYDLFIENRLFYDYAKKEMNPEQIDI